MKVCNNLEKSDRIISENSTKEPCPTISSCYFKWSDSIVYTSSNFKVFKDSLINLIDKNSKLRITGLYSPKEKNNSSFVNLGLARADALAKVFELPSDQLQLMNDSFSNSNISQGCFLPASKFRIVRVSEKIKEIDDRTLIYFPVNSINKLDDTEVETYLNEVANRVIRTGEKIILEGHTDNTGTPRYNFILGQRRSNIIKQYLMEQGVQEEQITAKSKGETEPIRSNDTKEGMAENRRTELRIIN